MLLWWISWLEEYADDCQHAIIWDMNRLRTTSVTLLTTRVKLRKIEVLRKAIWLS